MGLQRYSQPAIVVEISDKAFGGTTIKRKVQFENMVYDQGGTGSSLPGLGNAIPGSVILNCTVQLFALGEGGAYGESLHGKSGFNNYAVRLVADNTTLVYAEAGPENVPGQLIGPASLQNDPVSFQDGGILDGVNYMYEYEFFRQMAANAPVVVDDVITQTIQGADLRGVF